MGKTSVILYVTLFLGFLLLLSHAPKKPSTHRRLKLRSNFNFNHHHHDPIPFDPVVTQIERRLEDRRWEHHYITHSENDTLSPPSAPGHESQPEWEDFVEAEDYLNDEEKFNVTSRLLVLFPKLDVAPVDGFVTEAELTEWNLNQAGKEVLHRTQREMDVHDRNQDGFISFTEYMPPSWSVNSDSSSEGHDMGWWKEEHFNAADADGDGLLNLTEFNDYLHPSDSKNPDLLKWLCNEEVKERDTDKDGKVNFNEFFHGLFDMVRNYDEEAHNTSHPSEESSEAPAKVLFGQLDKNDDGFLSDDELLPIIEKLHPSELYYAKQQADYMISQADTDKDGKLSLTEMVENPYVFYSAIFTEEEEEEYDHDEFR